MQLLHRGRLGGAEVVEEEEGRRLALMRVQGVRGPTAHSGDPGAVHGAAAACWTREPPGLVQQLLQRTAAERIVSLEEVEGGQMITWSYKEWVYV